MFADDQVRIGRRFHPERQRLDELQARGEAGFGVLGQRLCHHVLVVHRQPGQVGIFADVGQHDRRRVGAVERQGAGEHLLVDDGQAVLGAVPAHLAAQQLRGAVERRQAPLLGHGFGPVVVELVDQAEVGELDVVADEEQVGRLDVEVLQAVPEVDEVEGFGGLAHVAEQLVAVDAALPGGPALGEEVGEVAVGQFHDEDEFAVEDFNAVDGQQKGVAHGLDELDGPEFEAGGVLGPGLDVGVALDELDGLEDAAGRLALPDFAEAAAAERFDEPVAGQGLGAGFLAPFLFDFGLHCDGRFRSGLPGGPLRTRVSSTVPCRDGKAGGAVSRHAAIGDFGRGEERQSRTVSPHESECGLNAPAAGGCQLVPWACSITVRY